MLLYVLLQNLTPTVVDTAAFDPGTTGTSVSYLDLAIKGGWVMIPIALLSIVAVYIFIERFVAIRNAAKIDQNFMNRIKDYIHDGKIESATALCQSTNNPLAMMIEKGVSRIGRPLNDINTAIENIGQVEVYKLEKGLPILASCAGGAPMLGFFGTVLGMVRTFMDIASVGNSLDVGLLSQGIYIALITTVGGLLVGIPAFFAYNYLVARVEELVNKLEAHTMEFMDLLNEPVKRS
ncbi:MAG: MotA/TolQ/ExbB proton channel family protein [Bacteroidales bacterium]|nr:MotA/TolQ/ExbB proton channel family protein [Bacteroidales bacterium]